MERALPNDLETLLEQPEDRDDRGMAARHLDNKLQTPYDSRRLQTRLRNTHSAARTAIEEQGVNILFLALGFLQWYESTSSEIELRAPLVLVPVTMERPSAQANFRVRYSGEDLGSNLSLQAKVKKEFGIELPDVPEGEDLDLEDFFSKTTQAVSRRPRWRVDPEGMAIGFFSFAKFLMFKDLDTASWADDNPPHEHAVIEALLSGCFREAEPSIGEEDFLDDKLDPGEVFQVVDADSSQTVAVRQSTEGRNLVIQGPPGTGKSQTITNVVAEAVAAGKTVLFVAEKLAALEVVKRRLDHVHLGDCCLELHSDKANKRVVLDELQRTLKQGRPIQEENKEDLAGLLSNRDRLNAYARAVNTPVGESAVTPYQAFGHLSRLAARLEHVPRPSLSLESFGRLDRSAYRSTRDTVEDLQTVLRRTGPPARHPFWGSRKTLVLPMDRERLEASACGVAEALERIRADGAALAGLFTLGEPGDFDELQKTLKGAVWVARLPHLPGFDWQNPDWLKSADTVESTLAAGKEAAETRERFGSRLLPEAWDRDILRMRKEIEKAGRKWWRHLSPGYRRARSELESLCRGTLPKDGEAQFELADAILRSQRARRNWEEGRPVVERLFHASSAATLSWDDKIGLANRVKELHTAIRDGEVPAGILDCLPSVERKGLPERVGSIRSAVDGYRGLVETLLNDLEFSSEIRFGTAGFPDQSFDVQANMFADWRDRTETWSDLAQYNQVAKRITEAGLEEFVDASSTWEHTATALLDLFDWNWYASVVQRAVGERAELAEFDPDTHEAALERFCRLDRRILETNRAIVAHRHWQGLPRHQGGGQLAILLREFQKKRRHLPIRRLMAEAGHAIQAIKPVFMMSPPSIAKFVPPGSISFDSVIFDEASQVQPVDALGAILRGRHAVVVGDSKQLPPTRFFERVLDEESDEEEAATSDLESILGLFCAQGAPEEMLRWHYRSRHESLIAVSNSEFYDGKLVVFPSPDRDRGRLGLVFHHSPDTFYEPGASKRHNRAEAALVADAVMRHAREYPDLKLGVAAFSQSQAQMIEDELERRRRNRPEYEEFFRETGPEPFFVKNLENVQGDERDVILISVGYGRRSDGFMSMNFGPLNWEGGERRLNVLITRARLRCEVFSNFVADDIDLSRTSARGVVALKRYLKYAQTGIEDVPVPTGAEPESPFEEHVASELEKLGYTVHPQVGSGGFRVDLAVVDPEQPGRYLVGIECDGATYHRARSARDRDRLRQQVLEGLGWRIHRVWSTDWFRNPQRQLRRMQESIEAAKRPGPVDNPGPEVRERSVLERSEPPSSEPERLAEPYRLAELSIRLRQSDLHLVPRERLAEWVVQVVAVESPVHIDEVARRITNAAGLKRVGSRIRGAILAAGRWAHSRGMVRFQGDFLFSKEAREIKVRDRSDCPPQAKRIAYVCREEVEAALVTAVRRSFGISREDAVVEACRLLGFQRTGSEVQIRVEEVLRKAIASGRIVASGVLLRMGPQE
jgi:very-short-patch-repair endonuclease